LRHLISEQGITLLPSYVIKITEWPLPTTGKEFAAFLGFCGYYREFLPGFATIIANLNANSMNFLCFEFGVDT